MCSEIDTYPAIAPHGNNTLSVLIPTAGAGGRNDIWGFKMDAHMVPITRK